MPKFRKKPVVIEAWPAHELIGYARREWNRLPPSITALMGDIQATTTIMFYTDKIVVSTLEGDMTAEPSDWLIRGVQGEFYPCKPDIFNATYEKVED